MLVSGADFYSTPRPSPDGTKLAWVHPGPAACKLSHAVRFVLPGEVSMQDLQFFSSAVALVGFVRQVSGGRGSC